MKDFAYLQERYQILKGDDSVLTADTTGKSHINAAIGDITSAFPFSWTHTTTTGILVAGSFTLPADYNPGFAIDYAAIVKTELLPKDPKRMNEDGGDYGYNVSYNATTHAYTFNCQTLTGTVTYGYYINVADLSANSDPCVIPDPEAVAYLAASKNWIGSERNQALKADYDQEAKARVKSMIQQDQAFGAIYLQGSVLDYNNLS